MKLAMRGFFVILVFLPTFGCSQSQEHPKTANAQSQSPEEKEVVFLKASLDGLQLEKTMLRLLDSQDPKTWSELEKLFQDVHFWDRMDGKKDDYTYLHDLAVTRILAALVQKQPEKANKILTQLAQNSKFLDVPRRHWTAYYYALDFVRNPSRELLDAFENIESSAHVRFRLFAEMRSPLACEYMEKQILAPKVSLETHEEYFTNRLLKLRDEPVIVHFYHNILKKGLPDVGLRNLVLQTLFDYLPYQWYDVSVRGLKHVPHPPNRREAQTKALEEMVTIAELSKTLDLSKDARASVAKGLEEIQTILKFRRDKNPEKIQALISELDHKDFHVRQKARLALEKWGDWAEPHLAKTLKEGNPSLEKKTSVERLLKKIVSVRRTALSGSCAERQGWDGGAQRVADELAGVVQRSGRRLARSSAGRFVAARRASTSRR